jgi:hypothetical protein
MCTESSARLVETILTQRLLYGRVKDTFSDNHRKVVASVKMLICNNVAMIRPCTRETVEGYRINPPFFLWIEVHIIYLWKHGRGSKYIHPEYKPQAAGTGHLHT